MSLFFFFGYSSFFACVFFWGFFPLSFLFKFQQTDTSKATTRKPVEVITDFCVLPPPKLNSEIVLLIALNRDTTFSNKADNWIFLLAFKLWAVSVSEQQGLSEYFSFLKAFVLMKLEGYFRLYLHLWWIGFCSFGEEKCFLFHIKESLMIFGCL